MQLYSEVKHLIRPNYESFSCYLRPLLFRSNI